jgi:hypothetical protein
LLFGASQSAFAKAEVEEDISKGSVLYVISSLLFDLDTWIGSSGSPFFIERCHTISNHKELVVSPRYSRLGACLWHFYHHNNAEKSDYIFAQGKFVTDGSLFSVRIDWNPISMKKIWKSWWHEDPRYLKTSIKIEGLAPQNFVEKLLVESLEYRRQQKLKELEAEEVSSIEEERSVSILRLLGLALVEELDSWDANTIELKLDPQSERKYNWFSFGIGKDNKTLYSLEGEMNYYPGSEDWRIRFGDLAK